MHLTIFEKELLTNYKIKIRIIRIKLIKKFRYLSIRTTKTLIQTLFFTSDKIFGRPLLTLLFHYINNIIKRIINLY